MSELHDLLASEASRGPSVAGPPFETIVARSRRRRASQLLTVVGVVLVVTAAVVVPSVVGRHRTTAAPTVSLVDHGATTVAARLAITQQEAEQLAAGVQLPAGAVVSSTAPTPVLAQPFSAPGSQNLVDVARFYTLPGTIDAVLAYAQAHPPAGAYANGTSSSGDSSNDIISQGITFGTIATHDYAAPTVSVVATKFGAGVAVRVDALLVWRPLRTVAEDAPVNASSVQACYGGLDCPPSVLNRSDARELAAYFNSLDTQIPEASFGCDQTASGTTFTFETPAGQLTFAVSTCGGVTATSNGVAQPALDNFDVAMDPQLRGLLGLGNPSGSSPAAGLSALAPAASTSAAAPAVASNLLSAPTD
jgi:hypothetical protein